MDLMQFLVFAAIGVSFAISLNGAAAALEAIAESLDTIADAMAADDAALNVEATEQRKPRA